MGRTGRDRDRRPARGAASKEPRRRLLVVCEGKCTEPEYFNALKRHLKNPLMELQIHKERGDPKKIVEMAKKAQSVANERASLQHDSWLGFDEVWCVFDRDDHEHFDAAVTKAEDNNFLLAVSNPCFELWLLLHLREPPGARHRDDLKPLLRAELGHDYGKHPPFEVLKSGLDDAIRRAERLDQEAKERGDPPRKNLSTGVYRLVRAMRSDGPCHPKDPQP